jgi:L-rhamnose mutarotase
MKRYTLTLDLKNDPELIRQYEQFHKEVWPEIISSIKEAGIENMQIYHYETRLFMIMEENAKVQEWEELMWKFQQPLAGSAKGEKWKLMETIFELKDF